jgi:hypothetical protein
MSHSGERIEPRGKSQHHGNSRAVAMKAFLRVTGDAKEDFSKTWSASYPRKFV